MSKSSSLRSLRTVMVALVILVLLSACGGNAPTPTPVPTDTPEPPTATPTETPVPTDTPTPTPLPTDTPTPEPTSTPTPNLQATADAKATEQAQILMEQIAAQLETVNISSDSGELAWVQTDAQDLDMRISDYNSALYAPIGGVQNFDDFVLHTSVEWDSTSGLAGCGIIFRSESDLKEGAQYVFLTLRLSGLPAWDIEYMDYGQVQFSAMGQPRTSAAIDLGAGASNEFFLVVQGNTATVYANGKRIGAATVIKRHDGRIGVEVWQESGQSRCTYTDTWIYALNK